VSYWTHAGKRGRGYARNALALLAGWVKDEPGQGDLRDLDV